MGFTLNPDIPAKNRVGDFFWKTYQYAPDNNCAALYVRRENTPTATKPASGRTLWLSRDPIAENGGLNLYGYVGNNPINLIDPDGRNPIVRKIIQKILEKILKPKPKPKPKPKDKDKDKPPVPPGAPDVPDYNEDPSECPGEGYEWRGKGEPGSDEGSWYNPETDTSVHPDRNHPEPIGPHNDVHTPDGDYRQYPDGRIEPK